MSLELEKQVKEIVEEVAEEVGGKVRERYSGRFMYGKTCLGVVCSDPNLAIETASGKGLRGARLDNMGLDYIVYWPNPKLVDPGDKDESEEDTEN